MSRAFVRESDFPDADAPVRRAAPLPPGAPNYITPAGAARLQRALAAAQAARSAAAGPEPEARAARARLDVRIAELEDSRRTLQVVTGAPADPAVVRFGAAVRVRDAEGSEATFRIVGVDEADAGQNWIAWVSPAARALLNARVGQKVTFRRPTGETSWEILAVDYE